MRNGYYRFAAILGFGGPSDSGEPVTQQTMLTLSAVWACSKTLAESFGQLPLHLYEESKSGNKERRVDHPLYRVLHDAFNANMTSMQGREFMMLLSSNSGNGIARIEWSGGKAVALWPYALGDVEIESMPRGLRYWEIQPNGERVAIPNNEVFHIPNLTKDGYIGMGVCEYARNVIGNGLAAQKYASKFFSGGGKMPGIIKVANTFKSDDEAKAFRETWDKTYGGPDNVHKNILLSGDVDFKAMGISPRDAQYVEWSAFSVPDICRFYRMPPHMVMDLSRATFSNIEHQGIEYVNYTLMPWLVRWEQQIQLKLISPDMEQRLAKGAGRLYAKFNVDALLRGDFASRWTGYATALQNGVFSIDDVLELEDRNRLPNGAGEARHIQLNMQTVPGTGEPTTSEAAQLAKLSAPEPTAEKMTKSIKYDEHGRIAGLTYGKQ
jgi:HK97 family phage portal protein